MTPAPQRCLHAWGPHRGRTDSKPQRRVHDLQSKSQHCRDIARRQDGKTSQRQLGKVDREATAQPIALFWRDVKPPDPCRAGLAVGRKPIPSD